MQCNFSQAAPSIQNIQNQAQTVTISRELANDAADALYFADIYKDAAYKLANAIRALLNAAKYQTDINEARYFCRNAANLADLTIAQAEGLENNHPFNIPSLCFSLNDAVAAADEAQAQTLK